MIARRFFYQIILGVVLILLLVYFNNRPREVNFQNTKLDSNPFAAPLCYQNGTCHEESDKPSPRTVYSAKSKTQYERWWNFHAVLNQSAADYVARRISTTTASRPFILLGDSITESWLGTSLGVPYERAAGVKEVLEDYMASFEEELDPLVLGISGDQTQHLLYRLQNGELLPNYANDETAVFVVMIGANNLGKGMLPGCTASGVFAVAEYLLTNTKGTLLVFKLLPRGNFYGNDFMPNINKVNGAIESMIPIWKETYGNSRVDVLDCGSKFLVTEDNDMEEGIINVNENLMPDLLHPNVDGHKILAECMLTYIRNRTV